MTEADKATETEEATEQTTASDKPAGKTYSQEDMDAITERVRATERKKLEKVSTDFEAFKASKQTEEEKAAESRQKAQDKALETAKAQAKKEARLIGVLIGKGKSETQAERLAAAVGTEWETTEEALTLLTDDYGLSFDKQSTRVGGGGGDPPGKTQTQQWTPEVVEEVLTNMSPQERAEWWTKNGEAVEKFQQKDARIRTYGPGEFTLG
jgi:hypothetical protein